MKKKRDELERETEPEGGATPTEAAEAPTKPESTRQPAALHTVPNGDGWANNIIVGRESERYSTHTLKDNAVDVGRKEAMRRKIEHVIHGADGTIQERNSYGNDPSHRPG